MNGKREWLWKIMNKAYFKWSIPFSVVAGYILILCESYYAGDSWDKVFGGKVIFLSASLRTLLVAVPVFLLFQFLCSWKLRVEDNSETAATNKKKIVLQMLLLLLCWLPYMVIMFPGNFCPDATDELAQITGNYKYCWTIKTIVTDAKDVLWNNHHPVFYTWILSVFVKIGKVIGSYTWSFALYTLLQCVAMAGAFVYFLEKIKDWGVSDRIRKGIFAFFALNPLFPLWSVTITKDIYFSIVLLMVVLQLYTFFRNPESFGVGSKVRLGMWMLLLMLLRNNGFYMLVAILPFIVWVFWKKKKKMLQIMVSLVVPLLIFQIGIQGMLFSALNIPGGSIREMLSVPFQQTARYIRDYGSDMEEDEILAVEKILGRYQNTYIEIGESYVPDHADNVKNKFLPEADGEDLKNYLKAWLKGLKKHPDAYIEAFLNLNYPWFFTESKQDFHYYYEFVQEDTRTNMDKMEKKIEKMLDKMERIAGFDKWCAGIMHFVNNISRIPVLGWLLEFSFYTWLYIICAMLMLIRRKYKELLACGILLANYAICFVGPVAYTRYAIPMMVCAPLVILIAFMEKGTAGRNTGTTL